LLASLDADCEQAGQKYERIRLKLIHYFAWRGTTFPEAEADETINRVAQKIEAGEEIKNLNAYFYGVARLVFAESLRIREREQEAIKQAPLAEVSFKDYDSDSARRRVCLANCLRHLPEESRDLIIEYYQDEQGKKIKRRKDLASRLDIPVNALRIRAHRIRTGLEMCVKECLGKQA
jgi:DNA-directed RNA polymerase specialized sigma24 family protein